MTERQEEQVSCATRTWHPLIVALAVAYSYLFVLAAVMVLAFLAGREGFEAEPPRVAWQFVATFLSGIISFTLFQLALLYRFKPKEFWPHGPVDWLKCTGPVFPFVLFAIASSFTQLGNGAVAVAALAMLFGVGVGMIPSLLCFRDWFKYRAQNSNETIQLRPVAAPDLPRVIRSYFDAHTSALVQLGFQPIGDFRLKQHSTMFARCFLHRDGDTFAEICYSRVVFLPLRAVCFVSLSPAGHYLESSNMRFGGRNKQIKDFEMQVFPHLSKEETFERHRARLRELDQGQPRQMLVEDLESVIHYGNKHLYELMISEGVSGTNPYADFDESKLAPRRQEAGKATPRPFDTPWDTPSLTEV